ncbi:PKD domain-containing protein [bacterium]|nr:PKD domain-containing protein [bacterium]
MNLFYTRLILLTALISGSVLHVSAQTTCKARASTNKSIICLGDSAELSVGLAPDTSLTTTFAAGNGQSGNMFVLTARKDIVITNLNAHPQGTYSYSVYYKKGTYRGFERDSTKWTLLGRAFNVSYKGFGRGTALPIDFAVHVKKGDSVSFYVTAIGSGAVYYTNGTITGKIYKDDGNVMIRQGHGLEWPFGNGGTLFNPRIFNGRIFYYVDKGIKYQWTSAPKDSHATAMVGPRTKTKYYIKVTKGSCTAVDSVVVDVENFSVNLGPDTSLCDGSTIQLDAGKAPAGASYNWKPGGTGSRYKLISAGGEKSVVVTTAIGCKYRDTIFIKDRSSPKVDLGGDVDLCDGDSVVIDGGNFGSLAKFEWSTNETTQKITVKKGDKINLTVTDSFGCEGKDKMEVFLRPSPVIDFGSDKEVCEGDTITLDPNFNEPNSTYKWSTNESTNTIEVTQSGSYSVEVTSAYGCSDRDTVSYTFHGKPMSGMPPMMQVCDGMTATLDAGKHGPNTKYFWSNNAITQKINVGTAGTYKVLITDSFGCMNTDSVMLKVRNLPKVNLGADIKFCKGNTAKLDAGFDDGYTQYNWSTGDSIKSIIVKESGTYEVTVTDSFGCQNSDQMEVTVFDLPRFEWNGDTAVCNGKKITLDPGNHETYKWNTGDKSRTIEAGPGSYSVIISNIFGCENEDTITVDEIPTPKADFSYTDNGQTITFSNKSSDANSYKWDFGDGSNSNDESPEHWYKTAGSYTVVLKSTNECGDDQSSQTIEVSPSAVAYLNENNTQLYPNPAHGSIFIEIAANTQQVAITVSDISGKNITVDTRLNSNNTWQVNLPQNLKAGLYFCTIKTEKGLLTKRFVLE